MIDRDLRIINQKKVLYSKTKNALDIERKILDSLKSNGFLSQFVFDFYNFKLDLMSCLVMLETDNITLDEVLERTKTYLAPKQEYDQFHYHMLLDAIALKYYKNTDMIDLQDGVNRDHRQFFDFLELNNDLSEYDKTYLLTRTLARIHSVFSHDDFVKYYRKYVNLVENRQYLQNVQNTYAMEFDSSGSQTVSLVLMDYAGRRTTFDEFKEQHKGRVIYVDFWASWCAPCREAFPRSAALRDSLSKENVVFVYLSIDTNVNAWRQAAERENLIHYPESYLIMNQKNSEFLKKFKISEIPRYMIFDKVGLLTHANAPRVETSEAGLLLIKMANNER